MCEGGATAARGESNCCGVPQSCPQTRAAASHEMQKTRTCTARMPTPLSGRGNGMEANRFVLKSSEELVEAVVAKLIEEPFANEEEVSHV